MNVKQKSILIIIPVLIILFEILFGIYHFDRKWSSNQNESWGHAVVLAYRPNFFRIFIIVVAGGILFITLKGSLKKEEL
ncbi:MAG: hypothetical protein V1789_07640 [PVC group bacterium]